MKAAHLIIRNSIQIVLWLLWLLNSLFLLYNWALEEWCYILFVNCTHKKPAWGKSFSLTLWNLVFKCLYLQYLWADLMKCRVAHIVFLYCPARVCWKYWGCECEVSRMQLLYFGCILHNGHSVKSGAQLWLDSQQRSACPGPSEPGTESLGWDPLAACQHSIVLLDSQCSHWLTLGFTFSAASVDSHISSLVPCQGFSCFQWRTELDKQHPVSVSWTSPQLEDNSWFLFFSFFQTVNWTCSSQALFKRLWFFNKPY